MTDTPPQGPRETAPHGPRNAEARPPLVVLGAGLFGDQLARLIEGPFGGVHTLKGFIDDRVATPPASRAGAPVLGSWEAFAAETDPASVQLVLAVGYRDLRARLAVYERARAAGFTFARLTHPAAVIAPDAVVGDGVILQAGACVDAGAAIGDGGFIDLNVSVCERARLGPCCYIAAGAAIGGGATLGAACFVGLNGVVVDRVRVGDGVRAPAGGLIHRDVAAHATVMEARTIRAIPSSQADAGAAPEAPQGARPDAPPGAPPDAPPGAQRPSAEAQA